MLLDPGRDWSLHINWPFNLNFPSWIGYCLKYKAITLTIWLMFLHHLEVVWVWDEVQMGLIGVNKLNNIWLTPSVCLLLKNHLNLNLLLSFHGEFSMGSLIKVGENLNTAYKWCHTYACTSMNRTAVALYSYSGMALEDSREENFFHEKEL